ncbi:MAG: IreB family regulatory phosphoprotein [Burkholderiales bacterium]|jgi:uncharacterized protein (UPF0297 family)
MAKFDETMRFSLEKELSNPAREVIWLVCDALKDKGYDPVSQLVGYIISGDPTYITSYKNARSLVKRVERDELLEEFVKSYIENMTKAEEE